MIYPESYVIQYNTSTVVEYVDVPATDITIHAPVDTDETGIHKKYVATIVGLTHSTTYHFIVIPANSLGQGAPSLASNSATTLANSIPGVAYFIATKNTLGSDRVYVEWRLINTGGLACTFDLHLVDTVNGVLSRNITDVSSFSLTISGLVASRVYHVYITSKNSIGSGSKSNFMAVTSLPPTVPGDLSQQIVVGSATSESMLVQWHPPALTGGRAILGYRVEVEEMQYTANVALSGTAAATFDSNTLTTSVDVTAALVGSTFVQIGDQVHAIYTVVSSTATSITLGTSFQGATNGALHLKTGTVLSLGSRHTATTTQNTTHSTVTQAEVTGLLGHRAYRIYVLAINAVGTTATDGNSSRSSVVRTLPPTVPGTILLQPTAVLTSTTCVIAW